MSEIKEVLNLCLQDRDELYDREARRLYLNSEVDETIIDNLVYSILRWNREDKGIPTKEREPIILYIKKTVTKSEIS